MNEDRVRCGLEVHAQINFLKTKLFCSCSIEYTSEPNKNTCPICRGLPGSLPSVNGDAVKLGLKLAKSLEMKPISVLKFSRKHYDYPDLPKGFQITQNYDGILGTHGKLVCNNQIIPIKQIQLEEDPAKLSYFNDKLLVDYNRSGVCLIELVTDPVFTNRNQIKSFLQQYRRLLYSLGLSDTRKESSFRVDVNVSVGEHPRVEVKNVGSDSDILDAFSYEIARQSKITDYTNLGMETRNWLSDKKVTEVSRDKESSSDYKYIPEGNIPIIEIPSSYIDSISLGKLPWVLEDELKSNYSLADDQIQFLLDNIDLLKIFKTCMNYSTVAEHIYKRFFWQEFLSWYNNKEIKLSNEQMNRLISFDSHDIETLLQKLENDSLSNQKFKKIFRNYILDGKSLEDYSELDNSVDFTKSVVEYLQNTYPEHFSSLPIPQNKINFLVGLGVKYSKGKVNPKALQKLLRE